MSSLVYSYVKSCENWKQVRTQRITSSRVYLMGRKKTVKKSWEAENEASVDEKEPCERQKGRTELSLKKKGIVICEEDILSWL